MCVMNMNIHYYRDVAAAQVVEHRGLAAAGLAVKLSVEVSLSGDTSLGTTNETGMSYHEVENLRYARNRGGRMSL